MIILWNQCYHTGRGICFIIMILFKRTKKISPRIAWKSLRKRRKIIISTNASNSVGTSLLSSSQWRDFLGLIQRRHWNVLQSASQWSGRNPINGPAGRCRLKLWSISSRRRTDVFRETGLWPLKSEWNFPRGRTVRSSTSLDKREGPTPPSSAYASLFHLPFPPWARKSEQFFRESPPDLTPVNLGHVIVIRGGGGRVHHNSPPGSS